MCGMGRSVIQDDSANAGDEKAQQVSRYGDGILPLQQVRGDLDEQRGRRGGQPLSRLLERNHGISSPIR
jgi:hypothetical protein